MGRVSRSPGLWGAGWAVRPAGAWNGQMERCGQSPRGRCVSDLLRPRPLSWLAAAWGSVASRRRGGEKGQRWLTVSQPCSCGSPGGPRVQQRRDSAHPVMTETQRVPQEVFPVVNGRTRLHIARYLKNFPQITHSTHGHCF